MRDLTSAIEEFLAKYPADAPMEWKGKPPRTGTESDPKASVAWAATLTTASERHAKNKASPPH